jgi:hypothetical protein
MQKNQEIKQKNAKNIRKIERESLSKIKSNLINCKLEIEYFLTGWNSFSILCSQIKKNNKSFL